MEISDKTIEGRLIGFAVPKVTHYFGNHVGFAGMFPAVKQVVIDPDWEEHVPTFPILALKCSLDLPQDRPAGEGMLRADDKKLVVVVNRTTPPTVIYQPLPCCASEPVRATR